MLRILRAHCEIAEPRLRFPEILAGETEVDVLVRKLEDAPLYEVSEDAQSVLEEVAAGRLTLMVVERKHPEKLGGFCSLVPCVGCGMQWSICVRTRGFMGGRRIGCHGSGFYPMPAAWMQPLECAGVEQRIARKRAVDEIEQEEAMATVKVVRDTKSGSAPEDPPPVPKSLTGPLPRGYSYLEYDPDYPLWVWSPSWESKEEIDKEKEEAKRKRPRPPDYPAPPGLLRIADDVARKRAVDEIQQEEAT